MVHVPSSGDSLQVDLSVALRLRRMDLLQWIISCHGGIQNAWSSHIATIIVAVVLPFRLNHVSEYFGPMTWYIGCAIEAKNYEENIRYYRAIVAFLLTCPMIRRA